VAAFGRQRSGPARLRGAGAAGTAALIRAALAASFFFTASSRDRHYGVRTKVPETLSMDAVYLLLVAVLYGLSHALVWLLDRLRAVR
jgi:hypothetical protein